MGKFQKQPRRRAIEYEKALAQWWKKARVFERSVSARPEADAYVFYDGPPFITGMPHHGTLLSSIVKDAVPRFWTMRGKRCERRWGWDCHGLPAENFVEQQLGIKDRREIGTKWSLEEYIIKARESMVANSETWEATIDRIGRWVDFRGAYRTMDKDFMESVWWAFKKLYEAGKIYEGRKVLMYDTKFATPVSKAEVTMDNDAYREVTDPSVYVKFKIENSERAERLGLVGANLVAWTTTPWTLPANLLLAVNPRLKYGIYEIAGKKYIMAEKPSKKVVQFIRENLENSVKLNKKVVQTENVKNRGGKAEKSGEKEGDERLEKIGELAGEELIGLEYEPLFRNFEKTEKKVATYTVQAGEFVAETDGTGIVHCAPAYGEDDYALMMEVDADFVDVLDENGYYNAKTAEWLKKIGVRETDEHGIEAWAANKFIAKSLAAAGTALKIEYIKHDYPFNPRSKQRIMYRAFPSWFFDIQGSKPLMLAENENINWFPEHLKHGRFAKNIEQAPDWNLSRDRFWATAMPVWKGDKGSVKVVGSYDELFELSGVRLEDYHRPWVDAVEFDLNGEHFRRIDKVLDCWFESGSMPFAQMHYPFENREKFEANYPADFIVEYVGQVRAWFYYVHTVNTALAQMGAFGERIRRGAAESEIEGLRTGRAGRNAFKNVITTGTLAGNDGRKMSKSLGNFTDPNELMDKYSADSLRFLLLSSPVLAGEDFALLDKDVSDTARKLTMIWHVYDFFMTYAVVDGFWPERGWAVVLGEEIEEKSGDWERVWNEMDLKKLKNVLDRWVVSRAHELRNEITTGMEEYNLPKALGGVLKFIDDLSNWFVRRSRRRFWKAEDDTDKTEAYVTLYYVLVMCAKILAPFVPFLAEELYQGMKQDRTVSVHLLDWPAAGGVDERVVAEMARTREIISMGLALRMEQSETEAAVKIRQPLAELHYEAGDKKALGEEYEVMIRDEVNVKKVLAREEFWLDKKLTPELKEEGWTRELVRVVQATRKKAGLEVDDRIKLAVSCDLSQKSREILAGEVLATEIRRIGAGGNFAFDEIVTVQGEEIMVSLEKA